MDSGKSPKRPAWLYVLVGCGVVGCLCPLGGLVTAVVQGKHWANVGNCMNRITESGRGIQLYSQDHDDRFPNVDLWADMTMIYRKDPEALNCPVVGKYGYAMNDAANGIRLADVPKKRSTPLLFESKELARNAHGNPRTDSCPPRHNRRNTRIYVDGSVKFIANNYP